MQAFSPGDTISGKLHFTLDEAKSYHFIIVGLHGSALTTVASRSGSTETYVKHTTVLWNHQQSPNGIIGPGTFEFDFQFTLPVNCPGSFEGRGGHINYICAPWVKSPTSATKQSSQSKCVEQWMLIYRSCWHQFIRSELDSPALEMTWSLL